MTCQVPEGQRVTVQCNVPKHIELYDPPECPSAELTIFECPKHGTLENLGDGRVTYTPCENYLGKDWFSYTLGEGSPAPGPDPGPWPSPSPSPEPGQGVVWITVEGSCCFYEVFGCGLQPLEERTCIPKEIVDRKGAEVFRIAPDDDTCYMADTSCLICPPYDGITLSDEEKIIPVPYGCDNLDCFECEKCGDCCFSTASVVRVTWYVGDGDLPGGDAYLESQLDAVRNNQLTMYSVEDPTDESWQQTLEPLNCHDPDSEPPKNKTLAALGEVQYSCSTNKFSFTLTYSYPVGPELAVVTSTESSATNCKGVTYDVTRWSFGGEEFDSDGSVQIEVLPEYNRCCYNGTKCCKLLPDCECSMADDGTCIGLVGDCECPSPP